MNNQEFLEDIENTYRQGVEIIKKKNQDYANSANPFKNFEDAATFAGVSVEEAFMVRIGDKWSRIKNLFKKEASVKDEKLEDTLEDVINYTAILKAYRKQQDEKAKEVPF